MRTLIVRDAMRLPLGKQGENEALRVVWPCIVDQWAKLYGSGGFSLAVQRHGDAAPYPAVVTIEGNDLVWTVTSADLANVGDGKCELVYTVKDKIAKSQTWVTVVYQSLTGGGTTEPPDPYQSWVDEVLAAGANAQQSAAEAAQSASDAEEAAGHTPYPNKDTGTWWVWDASEGDYKDTGESYRGSGGGESYIIGYGLKLEASTNTLSVNSVNDFNGDNTLPITAAAVQTTVGNIDVILGTI